MQVGDTDKVECFKECGGAYRDEYEPKVAAAPMVGLGRWRGMQDWRGMGGTGSTLE
jgi:hypothetical protein